MADLLIHDPQPPAETEPVTRFGGRPPGPDAPWPTCRSCQTPQQFLGQIRLEDPARLLLLFQCEYDPGACETWEADAGANHAETLLLDGTPLALRPVPTTGLTTRPATYGARTEPSSAADYDTARNAWTGRGRDILGLLGGAPSWIQGDQTPACPDCAAPMRFVAQLEQGPDAASEMNLGGGCAYVFECTCAHRPARLLWQQ